MSSPLHPQDKSIGLPDAILTNPFTMGRNLDVDTLRKKMEEIKIEQKRQRGKPNESKKVILNQIHGASTRKKLDKREIEESEAKKTLKLIKEKKKESETRHQYINRCREMFRTQYCIDVKRAKIQQLQQLAEDEESRLESEEKRLAEEAKLFDTFLRQSEREVVEAMRRADDESKLKAEKEAEIKKLTLQLAHVKSETGKFEEILKEYQGYKKFLDSLAPEEWRAKKLAAKKERMKNNRKKGEGRKSTVSVHKGPRTSTYLSPSSGGGRKVSRAQDRKPSVVLPLPRRKHSRLSGMSGMSTHPHEHVSPGSHRSSKSVAGGEVESGIVSGSGNKSGSGNTRTGASTTSDVATSEEEEGEEDEDLDLYFTHPQQLLDIYTSLEDQNLSLIQNAQETEEALEHAKKKAMTSEDKMQKEISMLRHQLSLVNTQIVEEEKKISDLKQRISLFSVTEKNAEDKDDLLKTIYEKVIETYETCIGPNESNLSILEMLLALENKVESQFQALEQFPKDKVEAALKKREKLRRRKLRDEKLFQQQQQQQERTKKAMERAQAPIIKHTGRRPVYRSQPPLEQHQKEKKLLHAMEREEQENAYYFSACCSRAHEQIRSDEMIAAKQEG